MVITGKNTAIPVGWMIHSSLSGLSIQLMLDALARHMGEHTFCPSVVIIDDSQAEINALEVDSIWCEARGRGCAGGHNADDQKTSRPAQIPSAKS
jgi:hypothetical protein